MDEDGLDPRIEAAMRDVTPATDELRERHIANALGAADGPATSEDARFDHERSGRRGRWMYSAAAVALLVVGVAFGRATAHRSPTEPTPGSPTTTLPPKTGVGKCVFGEGSWGDVGWRQSVIIAGVPYVFTGRDGAIDIVRDDTSCTPITWVDTSGK